MKRSYLYHITILVLAVGLLGGCAAKQDAGTASPAAQVAEEQAAASQEPWGDRDSGLIMTYRLPEGEPLKYQSTRGFIESVEIMGRTDGMSSTTVTELTIAQAETAETDLQLSVTVDQMHATVNAMGREIPRPVGEMIGKSFEMTLSPLGEVKEFGGTEQLGYRVGPFGNRSIETDFEDFFPMLADRPLQVGDQWSSKASVTDTRDASMTLETTSVNTFAGFETVDGVECIKITAQVSGTLTGEAKDAHIDITFDGAYEGSDVWYFSYEEGLLVSRESSGRLRGSAFDARAQAGKGMTVPMNREFSNDIRLVR
jgi:hypothetical protein